MSARRAAALGLSLALASVAHVARAQHVVEIQVIQLDPQALCPAPALPAASPDGHRIALVRCATSPTGAQDIALLVLSVPSGRVTERLQLVRSGAAGAHATPEATVARNVARANQVLAQGRFSPLDDLASPDVPLADANGAGITARYVLEAHTLVVDGVATAHAPIAGWPSGGACCDEGAPAHCTVTPVIRGAWVDPAAHFILVRLVSDDGPEGCRFGPDFRVIPLRAVASRETH